MAEGDQQDTVLDLSRQGLKKFNRVQPQDVQGITSLIVDGNELQRWDHIDGYTALRKLSAAHNQLLRMYGVSRLHHLCTLNLAHNSILTIEGLKELVHLKWLCLAANNIKTIEHLHTNIHLEHLDLSENNITHISDMSFLKNLKQLLLHGNRITQLRQCERYVPAGLVAFTLASNNICDLNEVSHLVHLTNLREFSIMGNPCVNMTGNCIGFDYRPFVINWCMGLKVIDGFVVDAIESLKAEWLYSQGRGRQFRVGEHQALIQYLASVCPLTGDSLESEEERKLRLILSKAQQHQQQLREQVTTNGTSRGRGAVLSRSQSSPAPSPATRRRISGYRNTSPRRTSIMKEPKAPTTDRGKSPDRMISSCQNVTENEADLPMLMTQSLDPALLFTSSNQIVDGSGSDQSETSAGRHALEESISEDGNNCPLQAATKLVPVPESLMSPDYRPVHPVVTRVARPRASTLGNSNDQPSRGNSSARGSPKLCRSLHSSPRARTRSMIESRRVSSSQALERRPVTAPQLADRKHRGMHGAQDANSSDEDSEMSASKLETIRHRAQERWQRKESAPSAAAVSLSITEHAAVCIQKMWRGYRTRNLNEEVQAVYRKIQDSRIQQYIWYGLGVDGYRDYRVILSKLSSEIEATKAALESDRKLHLLKMQAINAIWKKVLSMQTPTNVETPGPSTQKSDSETLRELKQTCSLLHSQVEQLQGSVQSILQCISTFCPVPVPVPNQPCATATQTDIVAVNTPLEESVPFPYQRGCRTRPSSLPILQRSRNSDAPQELKQFATSLVDGVLRTVAGDTEPTGNSCTSDGDPSASAFEDTATGCTMTENENTNLAAGSCGKPGEQNFNSTEDTCVVSLEHGTQDAHPAMVNMNTENDSTSNGNTIDGLHDVSGAEEELRKNLLSEENSSNAVLCKDPPSPLSGPYEADSPNNNQCALSKNVDVLQNGI